VKRTGSLAAALGVAGMLCGLALTGIVTHAEPQPEGYLSLPRRHDSPVRIVVSGDPFIAFPKPHETSASTRAALTANALSGPGPGRAPVLIDAPTVPDPDQRADGAAGDQIVLCDVWSSAKPGYNSTAVFHVGSASRIVVVGDDVGGYVVSSIAPSLVTFKSGESMTFGNCGANAPHLAPAPASKATPARLAPAPVPTLSSAPAELPTPEGADAPGVGTPIDAHDIGAAPGSAAATPQPLPSAALTGALLRRILVPPSPHP
jgi:hypothetical protein